MAFRVGGLPAGTYRLVLTAGGGRLRHTEEVDVNSDRELLIELTTGGVAGRVIDTGGLLTVRVDAADGHSWSGSLHVPAAGAV